MRRGKPPGVGGFTNNWMGTDPSSGALPAQSAPYLFGLAGQGNDVLSRFGGGQVVGHIAINPLTTASSASLANNLPGMRGPVNNGIAPVYTPITPGYKFDPTWGISPIPNNRGELGDPNNNLWTNVCTPDNYPNCDMTVFQGAPGDEWRWTDYWGYIVQAPVPTADGSVSPTLTFVQGGIQKDDVWGLYTDSIEKNVENYARNGLDALDQVNTQNTTNYDPCAGPGFFGKLIPGLLGAVAVIGMNVFGAEYVALLPGPSKGVLDVTAALTGYYAGKATMAETSWDGTDRARADAFYEKQANAMTGGIGFIAGQVAETNCSTTRVPPTSSRLGWLAA